MLVTGTFDSRTFVVTALGLPTNLGVGRSLLFPASSIKFLTRGSLKSQWVFLPHMKITVSNCWVLLDPECVKTVSWSTWRYVDSSSSFWLYDQNCRRNPRAGWPFHDFRFYGAVAVVTKISFCWWCVHVSMWTSCLSFQSNAVKPPLVLLCHPFSISVVLVQSQGACLFCWAVLYRLNLFYVCSSKKKNSLGNEKKLSVNILCPKPSNL